MDARLFHARLYESARPLMPVETGIVCAVSGGPDSISLLHGLEKVNEIHQCQWRIIVAHLDHGLRRESRADTKFVGHVAMSLGLEFDTRRINVAEEARVHGVSIETAGRRVRYEYLEDVALRTASGFVAVGHHADDQAETVLHRIARGTGLRGLSGIAPSRPIRDRSEIRLVRPLLAFRREELARYLAHRGLASRQDPTNDDATGPTRNRIRHQVLPLLEGSVNPEVVTALARLSEQARRAGEALRLTVESLFDRCVQESGVDHIIVNADVVQSLPRGLVAEIILIVLERLRVGRGEIGFERIEAVATLFDDNPARRRVELPNGAWVERRGRRIRFEVALPTRPAVRGLSQLNMEDC